MTEWDRGEERRGGKMKEGKGSAEKRRAKTGKGKGERKRVRVEGWKADEDGR